MEDNGGSTILNVSQEAAIVNHLSDVIGDWAKRKGFREEWEDADLLDKLAVAVDDNPGISDVLEKILDIPVTTTLFEELKRISQNHLRLANASKLALMHSELSEALEGLRDGDDDNYGEELADVIVRVLENAHANHIPIGDKLIAKIDKNEGRPFRHGRKF